jgi:hypothetical protein
MEKITFTRTQLYDLVWSMPTTSLAKEFGISDSSLRTTCKKFNIPLPYAGYWAIIKHGKPARKVKLPTIFEGKDEIVISPPSEKPEAVQKEISVRTQLITEIESNFKHLLKVPEELTKPDELIISAKKDLITDKSDRWLDHGLVCSHKGFISVKVAPENILRALKFMDTLIKLLKARGHDLKITGMESNVIIFEQDICICVQEKLRFEDDKMSKYSWNNRKYFPTGVFTFRMWKSYKWEQKVWIDGKTLIEDQLSKIVAGIELYAQAIKEEKLRREEYWRQEKEKKRLEQERFDREELDGANFKELLKESKKWKKAQILNEYIDSIENKANMEGCLTDDLQEWLKWAREKAERFNPLNEPYY